MTFDPALPEGYASARYAQSLRHAGNALALEHCGGWVLQRPISGSDFCDASGPYPIFACHDWSALGRDVETLARNGLVSLTLIADAFADFDPETLATHFDVVRPFKQHFVADLAQPSEQISSRHHRYEARKALRRLELDACWQPRQFLEEWLALYAHLVERHGISGPRAFPKASFDCLFRLPGVCLLRARYQGKTVGAQIIVLQKRVAHAHLAAFNADGYRLGASYALDWFALETLRDRARWIDWGGQPAAAKDATNGLSRYKKGWASTVRATWLLGAILDRGAYAALSPAGAHTSQYFPIYRRGEFEASRTQWSTANGNRDLRSSPVVAAGRLRSDA